MFNPLNVVIFESNHLDTQIVNQETLTNTNKFYHIKVLKRDQIVEMLRVWLHFDNFKGKSEEGGVAGKGCCLKISYRSILSVPRTGYLSSNMS